MIRILLFTTLFLFFSCSGTREKKTEEMKEKPTIAVVNYPLYYFANMIGRDYVTVYLPSIDGDPAYWKPDANQVINFQQADLILANGAGYAKWMEKVSLPSSKVIFTSAGFSDQWIEVEEGIAHSHGPEGEHVHQETAFTTWLNFKFAALQAEAVYRAISNLLPEYEEELKQNFELLNQELKALDMKIEEIASELEDQYMLASHPVYQYLQAGYKLNILSEHWEPDEMPTADQWEDASKKIKELKIRVMIWEDVPLDGIKSRLTEMGVRVVVFQPCANVPSDGDFVEIMNRNINQLQEII